MPLSTSNGSATTVDGVVFLYHLQGRVNCRYCVGKAGWLLVYKTCCDGFRTAEPCARVRSRPQLHSWPAHPTVSNTPNPGSTPPSVPQAFYNEKEARDLCRILLDAVKYIHDLGIVHRDLKPENLLMTSRHDDANIKLADFGFARSVVAGFVSTQCGTPGYVAPEILRAEPYGTVS